MKPTAGQIYEDIFIEIFKAAKVPDIQLLRKFIAKSLSSPVRRFSEFIAQVDADIGSGGFPFAAQNAIEALCEDTSSLGEGIIPSSGPLILACNHPGTYDGFVVISRLPRTDFKMIVSGIPFFRNLPNASRHLIFTTQNTADRMDAIRKSVSHLEDGGALIIFPSGRIDPDPAVFADADKHLSRWSRSIEVFLKKVPSTKTVLGIVSGVLSRDYTKRLFPKVFKNDHERRRIMEFMQVIDQMARGKPVELHPKVSFSDPVLWEDIISNNNYPLIHSLQTSAEQLLSSHKTIFYSSQIG